MEEELLSFLTANKIFSSLDENTLKLLLPKFTKIEVAQDAILFSQGDPSESLFLLVSGKLSASLVTSHGDTKIIGRVEPGECVGEAGSLTGEPRSLTVKALKNSILYKLSSKDFVEICYRYPSIMFATIHPLIVRSRNLIEALSSGKINKHFAIVPANKHTSLEFFYDKLTDHAESLLSITIFSEYHPDNIHLDSDALQKKILDLEISRKKSSRIIYLLKSHDSALARIAFKKSDHIYIAANYNMPPKIDNTLLDRLHGRETRHRPAPKLILLHSENKPPQNTAAWLALTPFSSYHHVRVNLSKDYSRLLRFLRGRAVGIVLGGGGTRGWAHLGAIKAIRESKIPIDIIGGTSVGAIVAACYAIYESYEDAYDRFYKIIEESANSVSWRSLTWPAISLFNAKKFTDVLMEVFSETHVEDLWLPYFCVSCNLGNNKEEIHRNGLLWQTTRASASIPGLIPPMLLNNELHLDGGLLNNLPVDIMRNYLGNKAKIIAVELNNLSTTRHKYAFPPILTFTQLMLYKFGLSGQTYKFPRFLDLFLRGLFIGSAAKSAQNSLAANLLVNADLGKFRLLHSNTNQADKLVDIGYQATMKQLNQARKDSEG